MFRVLIVEDDPQQQDLIRTIIEMSTNNDEVEYSSVDSLKSATEWVQAAKPDVVLLDLILPDSQGIETVRSFRKFFSGALVVMTGLPLSFIREEVGLLSVQAILSKDDMLEKLSLRWLLGVIPTNQGASTAEIPKNALG